MIQSLELEFNQSRSKSLRGNEETYATICFLFAAFFEPPEDSGEAKDRAAGLSPSQIPTKLQLSIKDLFGNRQLHEMLSRKIYDYIVLDAMKVWISSGDGNITATPARLELARAHNLKHGLVPAELCIRSNKMSSAMLRDAIDMIARFGDTAHIALLEPLLENKIMLLRAKRPGSDGDLFETQVRDHALSAMVHLSGQKYSDFGFELGQRQDDERVLPYTLAGFRTDDERGAALKRWREFRSNNKMP